MARLTDEQLLEALSDRLDERRSALAYAADSLRELRTVNRKLEAAEALKSQFLSNIRNEINNPLNAVQGLSALICNDPNLEREQVQEMAGLIHKEIRNLSFQMQNLFSAADLEAGQVQIFPAPVDLTTLAANIVGECRNRAADKRVTLALIEQAETPTTAVTDAGKVKTILTNLLVNAIEYSPEAGFVEVRLSTVGEEVLLEVRDHGPGIVAENRQLIFDRFQQLSTGTTKRHSGHGIGLSVVKAYAELLGGRIEMRSENGKGTLFILHLPRRLAAAPEAEEALADFLLEDAEAY